MKLSDRGIRLAEYAQRSAEQMQKREIRSQLREHFREHVRMLAGIEDISGLELVGMIRGLANLFETAEVPPEADIDLSGPRWGLLLCLMADEHMGNGGGLTPTGLSHYQNVSKNTISSLLRGLEEQGLVQRAIDPDDKRLFHIQLTERGRNLMAVAAPLRIHYLNSLVSGLAEAEKEQLVQLLGKLYRSVSQNCGARTPTENG